MEKLNNAHEHSQFKAPEVETSVEAGPQETEAINNLEHMSDQMQELQTLVEARGGEVDPILKEKVVNFVGDGKVLLVLGALVAVRLISPGHVEAVQRSADTVNAVAAEGAKMAYYFGGLAAVIGSLALGIREWGKRRELAGARDLANQQYEKEMAKRYPQQPKTY
jgi:hypothetical protein